MTIALPNIPVVIHAGEILHWISPDGDIREARNKKDAAALLKDPVIACHAPFIAERSGVEKFAAFDVLELFAFVRPAQFCVPTPNGLARALGITETADPAQQAFNLVSCIEKLLTETQEKSQEERDRMVSIAQAMAATAPIWRWSPFVLAALGKPLETPTAPYAKETLSVWRKLPEWEETPPRGAPAQNPVTPTESRTQLNRLVESVVKTAEPRPEQADYSGALTAAFQPPSAPQKPHWIVAEAGTGVGKTLGYLAPSLAWATKNEGTVWISTFTRHLQNQLQHDLDRIFPKSDKPQAVVRKGRENYLCLLNLDESAEVFLTGDYQSRIGMGLMLRWTMATRDGDLTGGDLPGWLPTLAGNKTTMQMADRRGECIHQACPHYQRCFIERGIRQSRDATVIVANHALTLLQPFDAEDNDDGRKALPTRFVFDEGHHLFEAADSAFSVALCGSETAELKRWLNGEERGKKSRRRGLSRRLNLIVGDSHPLLEHVAAIREATHFLPESGWLDRIAKEMPKNATEEFLAAVRVQVMSRSDAPNSPYSLETTPQPATDALLEKANALADDITHLISRLDRLADDLKALQDETKDAQTLRGIGTLLKSLQARCLDPLRAWRDLLGNLSTQTPEEFIDWLEITRIDGRAVNIGAYRHFRDPMQQFTNLMNAQAHGVVVTSATLKPNRADNEHSWAMAENRLGGRYLREQNNAALRVQIPSPFDYAKQTKIFLISDVDKNKPAEIANAYAQLFKAAKGGGMGLFTAIKRLQAAYPHIKKSIDGLPLYAQHVDGLNTATLVDIFRAEENSCILGTDALRDGVDVPGRALRLLVYDRIPWPRADILHKARRAYFGKEYDYFLTAMRLRQSFGRLVRTENDHGVFVLLESALPSRLYSAFPKGVAIEKTTLSNSCAEIEGFLASPQYAKVAA